jgi:hypothetical protein
MTETAVPPKTRPRPYRAEPWPLDEGLAWRNDRTFYSIPDVDRLPPFLMSVVSDGDRWMFASSTGALTAGRRDSTRALFPYETDDRLHRASGQVGPVTAIRLGGSVWRPFSGVPHGRRSLHKSVVGDELVHVDRHDAWGAEFSYRWTSSDRFGFVREAVLTNLGTTPLSVDVVDGLLDVLPHGVDPAVHRAMGNLTNAYKRSEVVSGRLAVFSLESAVSDRPEPSEVLTANVVWSVGLDGATTSVDARTLAAFGAGAAVGAELVTGVPGAYLLTGTLTVDPGESATWYVVGDVALDQADIVALRRSIAEEDDLAAAVRASTEAATRGLTEIMAKPDGLQLTGDPIASAHHFSNTTYNVMRGGVPLGGYRIDLGDFVDFVGTRNRTVLDRNRAWLAAQPDRLDRRELLDRVADLGDADLRRLALEYLPFSFSRRHGDPSRPWNAFSIRVRDDHGRAIVYHEGNWRDIFQNWEALCVSYPDYLPSVIATFLNASTPDGFNPYRITRDGIDWEVPEPENPWANIGYWGDHQIVYLLRLLELSERLRPGDLRGMLAKRWFTYADVPYRLAPHEALVADPKSTITFDEEAARRTERRVAEVGADGRLVGGDGGVLLVSMFEKLLVPALTKLSSFLPGGGIWMNTQRPEWNDANNALAGYGLSMVTLAHLRRYLVFLGDLVGEPGSPPVGVSTQVADWLGAVADAFRRHDPTADGAGLFHELGFAFSRYRDRIYTHGLSGSTTLDSSAVLDLVAVALPHVDATISANRRPDGLFHSYNLAHFGPDDTVGVEHLPEMLEGQVAMLDAGLLGADERADLVDALFSSAMYAEDRNSFMLYPARRIPSLLEKNVVSPADAASPLLAALLDAGDDSIVTRDPDGRVRFEAGFRRQADLEAALDRLGDDPRWTALVREHRDRTLAAYEAVFDHHAYTGRSGSMYGYEGIGSIYWHMVAKLLLAVQESVVSARRAGGDAATTQRLADAYWRVSGGLGYHKRAEDFGAIPIDPYSHTPAHAGAQQPGMTGLVKEELLARWLELGISFERGGITFDPVLVRPEEVLDGPATFRYLDVAGTWTTIELAPGSLACTLCQVPIVVHMGLGPEEVRVTRSDGTVDALPGRRLGPADAAEVFARSGSIVRIDAVLRQDG